MTPKPNTNNSPSKLSIDNLDVLKSVLLKVSFEVIADRVSFDLASVDENEVRSIIDDPKYHFTMADYFAAIEDDKKPAAVPNPGATTPKMNTTTTPVNASHNVGTNTDVVDGMFVFGGYLWKFDNKLSFDRVGPTNMVNSEIKWHGNTFFEVVCLNDISFFINFDESGEHYHVFQSHLDSLKTSSKRDSNSSNSACAPNKKSRTDLTGSPTKTRSGKEAKYLDSLKTMHHGSAVNQMSATKTTGYTTCTKGELVNVISSHVARSRAHVDTIIRQVHFMAYKWQAHNMEVLSEDDYETIRDEARFAIENNGRKIRECVNRLFILNWRGPSV